MGTADHFTRKKLTTDRIQVLTMGTLALVIMLQLAIGSEAHRSVYQMTAVLLNSGAMLFVSTWLGQRLEPAGKKLVQLGSLFLLWMAVLTAVDLLRITHIVDDGLRFSLYTPLFEYLMLLPYGAVRREEKKYWGLECMGWAFTGGAFLLLVMFAMQTFNIIPEGLGDILGRGSWEMRVAWLANIYASVFLIAIGFQLYFICSTEKRWLKALLLLLLVPEYCAIGLTQSRTIVFLSACLAAGTVFFTVYSGGFRKGSLRELLLGGIGAVLVLTVLVCTMQSLEALRDIRLYRKLQMYLDTIPGLTAQVEKFVILTAAACAAAIPTACFAYLRRLKDFWTRRPILSTLAYILVLAVLALGCLALLRPRPAAAEQSEPQAVQTMAEPSAETEETVPAQEAAGAETQQESGLMRILTKICGSRAVIWRETFREIGKNPRLLLFGLPAGEEIHMHYDVRETSNTHNSWLQTLVDTGIPGLLLTLLLSWAAMKNALQLMFSAWASLPQKVIGILLIAIAGAGFFEPSLFFAPCPEQFPNMAFLLCTGYAVYWVHREKAHK